MQVKSTVIDIKTTDIFNTWNAVYAFMRTARAVAIAPYTHLCVPLTPVCDHLAKS